MAYRNLDEFVIRLEQAGELILNTSTHAFPIVQDLFATEQRIAWALNVENLEALSQQVSDFILPQMSLSGLMSRAGSLMAALRQVNSPRPAPVQAVCLPPDLGLLPQYRPGSHPIIPFAHLVTPHHKTNPGDIIMLNAQTLGIHLDDTITEPTPAAVVIGGDPAVMWSTYAPLPRHIDPYWVAGWLRHKSVPMTQALTQPLTLPADAEIVVEGVIHPEQAQTQVYLKGKDGFYRNQSGFLMMQVTAITHRHGAIFPVMSAADLTWMNKAVERFFLPVLRMLLECVVDIHLPGCGSGRNLTIISIRKRTPGDVYRVLHGIWGMGELAYSRAVVIVDETVNVQDTEAVCQAIQQHVDWREDVTVTTGIIHPDDLIYRAGIGAKIGIDATHKVGSPRGMWDNAVRFTHDPADPDRFPADHVIMVNPQVDLNQPELLWRYILAVVDWRNNLQLDGKRVILDATFDGGQWE